VALTAEQIEYAKLMGKDPGGRQTAERLPHPGPDGRHAVVATWPTRSTTTAPTTRASPCSWAIRWAGWRWALAWPALVAIPLGFVIGMSPLLRPALDPFIQVLKPISPLAWMPLALYTIKDSPSAASS
jgi:nitrate/nitrite transport system permease protein